MYYVYGFTYNDGQKFGLAKSIYSPSKIYERGDRKIKIFFSSPNYDEAREIFEKLRSEEQDRRLIDKNFQLLENGRVLCECGSNIAKSGIAGHFAGIKHWEKLGLENPEKYTVISLECQISGKKCITTGRKSAGTKILRMPPKKTLKYQIINGGDYICRILGEFSSASAASSFKNRKIREMAENIDI